MTKHQSDRSMPRLSFPNGISSLAKVNGDEMPGVLLMLLLVLMSERGKYEFVTRHELFNMNKLKKWVKVLSDILAIDSFMRRVTFFKCNLSLYNDTLCEALDNMKNTIQRNEGNGMNIIKYHLFSHLIDDISRFGSCRNWSGGP